MSIQSFHISLLTLALLTAGGCSQSEQVAQNVATTAGIAASDQGNLVAAQIADTLQACSYDGSPVRFGMGGEAPRDCRDMIAQVMAFTGLPQNFAVTEADVPNAAAAILLDKQKLPHRVIAFNPQFIEQVRRETGGNPWSPVSVMAHEAGHHLAGHTIQPGGSQPPIELEADKFSGFVLYKMGASREDAAAALNALVPVQAPAGSTHPARGQRVAALSEGWNQACAQTGRADCDSGSPGSAPAPGIVNTIAQSPVTRESVAGTQAPAPQQEPSMRDPAPGPLPAAAPPRELPGVVVLPTPDPKALPSKGMQFIYDEFGILDPTIVANFEKQMYDHAKQWGVEIVTLLVKDLHGMTAEEYGWAMLRQLRVGKLDVGNGAVLVIAPEQGQVAAVMGPGVALQMASHDKGKELKWIVDLAWPQCRKKNACGGWTENLLGAADHIRRDTDDMEWAVRYQSLGDLHKAYLADNGTDPKTSTYWQKIVRFDGTVVNIAPKLGNKAAWVVEGAQIAGHPAKAVHVRSAEGLTVMLYLDPRTEALMPGGAMREGQRYVFIGRESGLSWNPKDTQDIDLLSYVLAQ